MGENFRSQLWKCKSCISWTRFHLFLELPRKVFKKVSKSTGLRWKELVFEWKFSISSIFHRYFIDIPRDFIDISSILSIFYRYFTDIPSIFHRFYRHFIDFIEILSISHRFYRYFIDIFEASKIFAKIFAKIY